MAFSEKNLHSLVKIAFDNGASDIHLRMNEAPCFRIRGDLVPVQTKPFLKDDIHDIVRLLLSDENLGEDASRVNELDGAYEIKGVCRLRFNIFQFHRSIGIILRIVNYDVPTIRSLDLPRAISKISSVRRGLVLITGATGSGKSTTLAAMINEINESRSDHIVTVEDPIEYVHPQKQSRISQREIGKDTKDFISALRSALRQDPDVVLIGEMRDAETVSIALKAAETGHLVLSTVHTTNAVATVGRIISMFPPSEQEDVRKRLAENLYATVSQRMLKRVDKGVVIAQEIMITNPGVKECIRGDEPLSRLYTIIAQGKNKSDSYSQTFDQHIFDLYQADIISKETALASVQSESDFLRQLELE